MKHFNISGEPSTELAKIMVTQESNNFGDQILSLKKLVTKYNDDFLCDITYYEDVAYTSRQEGDWMQIEDMKRWSESTLRKA